MILYFCDEINNIDFTYSLIKKLSLLILCDNNNKILLKNDIICCWLLDKMFENFENENELPKLIFKETENLYIKIFINSLIKATNDENLVIKLETILIWGSNKKNSYKDEEVFKFIRLILYDIYKRLNSIDDAKIFQYQNKSIEINIDNNSFLKNYLYITTLIFQFSYIYKNEKDDIEKNKDLYLYENNEIFLPTLFCSGMSLNGKLISKNIENLWKDFTLFQSSYKIFNYIFSKENMYKVNPSLIQNSK